MDNPSQAVKTTFTPLNYKSHVHLQLAEHLKPLSPYSRLMAGDTHEGSLGLLSNIPSPFSDMPIGVLKNIPLKRKLDDSCLDDSYETPAKKPYIPSTASPDLGLGCDSFNAGTPNTVYQQLPLETKYAIADVKSHLNLSSSSESCVLSNETGSLQSDGTPPNGAVSSAKTSRLSPETVTVNRGTVFDFNIDTILCLSPITCDAGHPIGANIVEGCLCPRSNGPLAPSPRAGQQVEEGPSRAVVEALEGKADEGIGTPIFESTICDDPDTPLGGGEHSFEDSLPLQVQVRSIVVVGNSQASSGSPSALPQESQRPVAFRSQWDWNRRKQLYMDSVSRHIQENPGPDTAMTELVNLMGQVTAQQQGTRWQHPSDLTIRNYQKRFGNVTPWMSLAEWKARNSRNHQGFSTVPKIFQRSPVP